MRNPTLNPEAPAREGIVLTQHYSASPLCAPARAALLTGRYNHRTGAVDVPSNRGLDRIALSERTIADCLAQAGYKTGMVGKWHNGLHDMRFHPNQRGFSEFAGFLNGGMDYYQWVLDRNGNPEPSDGRYLTDVFTTEACKFIQKYREEPFFLYLAYNAPHVPYQAPDELVEHYRRSGGLTENVCKLYAMVESMDRGIGKVLSELDSHGLRDNTLVVFTSDNGPYLSGDLDRYNGPYRGAKGDVLEGGIRVPCIARWPGQLPAGVEVKCLTHFCDWLPTLLSLSEVNPLPDLKHDGSDMSAVLRQEQQELKVKRYWQRNRYAPLSRCNGAMRDGPWKLVWPMRPDADWKDPSDNSYYYDGLTTAHRLMPLTPELPERNIASAGNPQLFKIDVDPHEDRDLAAEHRIRVDSMVQAWDAWFADVTALWRPTYEANTQPQDLAEQTGPGDALQRA